MYFCLLERTAVEIREEGAELFRFDGCASVLICVLEYPFEKLQALLQKCELICTYASYHSPQDRKKRKHLEKVTGTAKKRRNLEGLRVLRRGHFIYLLILHPQIDQE
jgi:hypothetical protein